MLFLIVIGLVVFLMLGDLKGSQNTPGKVVLTDCSILKGASKATEDTGGNRFCMLTRIDENKYKYQNKKFEDKVSLKKFCTNFRNYAASELRLYYDIKDIRRFVAGLGVSPIVILQGMSGTGKTSLAHAFGSFLENTSTVIPVQPMWKERTDLLGYYNEFTKRFNETKLLEKMYEANLALEYRTKQGKG